MKPACHQPAKNHKKVVSSRYLKSIKIAATNLRRIFNQELSQRGSNE